VHGHELQVVFGLDEMKAARETQLQPHDERQHQGDDADADRRRGILERDDLMVLAPDIFADPRLRMVKRPQIVCGG
jgi:hypothetical protein